MKDKAKKKQSSMACLKHEFFSTLGKGLAIIVILTIIRKLGLLCFEISSYKKWGDGYVYKNSRIQKG